jgi:hypothetical protein
MRNKIIALGFVLFFLFATIIPAQQTNTFVGATGGLQVLVAKVNVSSGQLFCNAVTCDTTIVIVPAKAKITSVIADLTTVFACTAICTSATLSFTAGKTAGGNEYLLSFDADAVAARFGLADANLGASISRATAIQGGDIPSWTAATTVQARFTSGTGNIGNGTVTNLSGGNVVFYVTYEIVP